MKAKCWQKGMAGLLAGVMSFGIVSTTVTATARNSRALRVGKEGRTRYQKAAGRPDSPGYGIKGAVARINNV